MTYLIVGWVMVSVGFLLGAAWSGLNRKNNHCDDRHIVEVSEMSSHSRQRE